MTIRHIYKVKYKIVSPSGGFIRAKFTFVSDHQHISSSFINHIRSSLRSTEPDHATIEIVSLIYKGQCRVY